MVHLEEVEVTRKSGCPGVTVNRISTDKVFCDDMRFLQRIEETTDLETPHYCIDLPCKVDNIIMPNNAVESCWWLSPSMTGLDSYHHHTASQANATRDLQKKGWLG